MIIKGKKGRHLIVRGDASSFIYKESFDLIITSPPYFHPAKDSFSEGIYPKTRDLETYSDYVAAILSNCCQGLKPGKFLCIIKTDAWYKGRYIPIGYNLANACVHRGLILHAHWIWEKMPYYSPRSPSFANIFVFAQPPVHRISHRGIITDAHVRRNKNRARSFTPEIYESLLSTLSKPGDIVLDPFVGVGSTIQAAANTDRWAVGIEISKEQIVNAKNHLSGCKAVILNGKPARRKSSSRLHT
jgi:DNA modification methylase